MADESLIAQEDLGKLYAPEIDLIHLIRTKYRFGTLTIETKEGRPSFIVETVVRTKLG